MSSTFHKNLIKKQQLLQKNNKLGAGSQNRTGKPKRQILSLLCLPISPYPQIRCRVSTYSHFSLKSACPRLFYWCPKRESNSQNLVSKTSTYTNSVIGAKNINEKKP